MIAIGTDYTPNQFMDRSVGMTFDDILIEPIREEDERYIVDILRRNLEPYDEVGSVLAGTFRRLENFMDLYTAEGTRYFVAKDMGNGGVRIGGAGIGPLHGLSPAEGIGEVRDMVLEKTYRGMGIGSRLLKRCIEKAKNLEYTRLYLETTPQMENAQKLFLRNGFRPVTQGTQNVNPEKMPCYFLLENLG